MPGTSGARGDAHDPRAQSPDVAVLMLSMHAEETLVRQALDGRRARLHAEERARSRSGRGGQAVAAGETVLDPGAVEPARR